VISYFKNMGLGLGKFFLKETSMRFITLLTATGIAALSMTSAISADGHATAVLKERQAHMKLYGKNLGTLGDMAKGAKPYDAAMASAAATELAALAAKDQSGFWVGGTDTSVKDSRALPDLFQNLDDVKKINAKLASAADAMVAAAGTDLDALRGAIGPIGAACGECHKTYRQPK
jgi:cytochrome c556